MKAQVLSLSLILLLMYYVIAFILPPLPTPEAAATRSCPDHKAMIKQYEHTIQKHRQIIRNLQETVRKKDTAIEQLRGISQEKK